jgi:hypothetical protein
VCEKPLPFPFRTSSAARLKTNFEHPNQRKLSSRRVEMNRRHYLLTIALSLAAGLAGHALYGPLLAPTHAHASAPPEPRRQAEWEYCAVVKAQAGTPRLFFWILYFRDEGMKTETVEATLGGNSYGKSIAKLGAEGWEMVGEAPLDIRPDPRPGASNNVPTGVFFKRRKD